MSYYLNPDYRNEPKTEFYCVRCQKDIKPGSMYVKVSVDFDTMQVTQNPAGEHKMGLECWKIISGGE